MTGQLFISRPSAFACSGPAPPKPISEKSLGSKPCSTETSRKAPYIFSLTISMMPAAARFTEIPNALAIGLMAFFRQVFADFHVSAQANLTGKITQHHVGIGHGGQHATFVIRRWTRLSTRTLWANAKRSG